jgi:hypothetical protein
MEIDIKVLCFEIADSASPVAVGVPSYFFFVGFFSRPIESLKRSSAEQHDMPRNQHNINVLIKSRIGMDGLQVRPRANDLDLTLSLIKIFPLLARFDDRLSLLNDFLLQIVPTKSRC